MTFTPSPEDADKGFTAEASDDPAGVAADAALARTTSNTTEDGRPAEPASHIATVSATDDSEVGANESLIEFAEAPAGGIEVTVDASGKPHFRIAVTKATKAKIGTGVAAAAMGAQFGLSYLVPEDSPTATALKITLWAAGIVGTALGIFLPTNKPAKKAKH